MAAERRPVTDEDRERVRAGHAEGKALRAIAKEIDRSPGVVGRIARELGLTFDHSQTAAATEAKVADNKSRRANIIAELYGIAEDEIEYLKQGSYNLTEVSAGQAVEYWVERLPAQDRRALVGSISTATQSAVRLEQVDSDEQQLPTVDRWLRDMLGGSGEG
jgi:hypothetical protein